MHSKEETGYHAGQCNIGPVEIKRRLRIGYIGLILMIVFILFAEYYQVPKVWKLFIFLPAFYCLSGFIQARKKFCYVYGYQGLMSFKGRKSLSKVKENSDLHRDRKNAIEIIAYIFIGSTVITLLYFFLPLIDVQR